LPESGQIVAIVAAALLFFWMVGAYNRLMRHRNGIGRAWAQFDEQLQRRAEALPTLLAALEGQFAAERSALDAVGNLQQQVQRAAGAMRAAPIASENAAALVAAMGQLDSALTRLLALLDQQPSLEGFEPVAATRRELHDSELRLAFARQRFNDGAQSYDAAITQFPTRLLTGFFRFGPAGRL
jgi:LemA protein